ncbi:cardiolipin synthase [Gammaproteobacteria bacterium LSUCC0057]|uniref:Cardiolipin synthase n=1 Tax=Gammaproteobacteria bacterium LSUCC0057 TaxID=2559237 RepID=A0A4Y8ULC1_9GAMM|nr:cardiolipin synthase [Gammaproteobacteria bacterium LSUCC0057]
MVEPLTALAAQGWAALQALAISPKTALALYLLLQLLAVALVVDAIARARTTQGAIAWAVALIAMPLVAVPLYLLFGQRRFYGYVDARRRGDLQIQAIATAAIAQLSREYRASSSAAAELGDTAPRQRWQTLEQLASIPATRANHIELLIDGEATFNAIMAAIESANSYLLVQFYIIRNDRTGRRLQQALIAAAQRGVAVQLLYDGIGSWGLSRRFTAALRRAGVKAQPFTTSRFNWRGRFQVNFRNHRKIVVVDGHTALVGGLNIGDEYAGHHRRLTPWRDTHLKLTGPAVLGVQLSFIEDWYWVTDRLLPLHWQGAPAAAGEGAGAEVLAIPTGPADELESCQLMFLTAINSAERELLIATPYFVPDEPVIKALRLAALRGVRVQIITPQLTDSHWVQLSSIAHMEECAMPGITFYQYTAGFMHQKVLLADRQRVLIGTANLDNRSFRLNFELTLAVHDPAFSAQVNAMLQQDLGNSQPFNPQAYNQRHWVRRALGRIFRLLAPLQ